MKKYSRIKAVVSLDAIAHNFQAMKDNLAEGTKMIAVLKADGYGHGAIPIADLIKDYPYIWGAATATAEEALSLRKAGFVKPILILGHVFEENYPELVAEQIRLAVWTLDAARKLSIEGRKQGKTVHIHLAVDTGMSRIGFADTRESVEEILQIAKLRNLELEGLFTHFARADEYDRSPAMVQLKRYQDFARMLREAGITVPMYHCSNSAGIIRVPEGHLQAVRAGITIYGIYPSDEVEKDIVKLLPAMELKSSISYVKEIDRGTAVSYGGTFVAEKPMKVATVPVGYADGYPRSLSNKGWVLIRGQRAPIVGRVCMDQMMVDVSHIPEARLGEEVTLLGQDGEEILDAQTLGDLSGRFSYELVCDISKRVPRVYVKDGKQMEGTAGIS